MRELDPAKECHCVIDSASVESQIVLRTPVFAQCTNLVSSLTTTVPQSDPTTAHASYPQPFGRV